MEYLAQDYKQMVEAASFLERLPIDDSPNPVLWCLHQVIWHYGYDRIRWITNNKKFVEKVALLSEKDFLFNDALRKEFQDSIDELKGQQR